MSCHDRVMESGLLERDAELALLTSALAQAESRGSVVLLWRGGDRQDECGAGVRQRARGPARVLVGACDDLLTPRTLGPLRDAVRAAAAGPLAAAVRR